MAGQIDAKGYASRVAHDERRGHVAVVESDQALPTTQWRLPGKRTWLYSLCKAMLPEAFRSIKKNGKKLWVTHDLRQKEFDFGQKP